MKSTNSRLQAMKFQFPANSLLVINVYFPCDPRSNNYDDTEIFNILSELNIVIKRGMSNNVLMVGDLNCHFERQSQFTETIKDYFDTLNLKIAWNMPNQRSDLVNYTYCGAASYSIIDRFVVSETVFNRIECASVIHNDENLSNHKAISLKFNVGEFDPKLEILPSISRSSWSKADQSAKDEYKKVLGSNLSLINASEFCSNIKCISKNHTDVIEEYTITVLEAMETSVQECLPRSGPHHKNKRKGNKRLSG